MVISAECSWKTHINEIQQILPQSDTNLTRAMITCSCRIPCISSIQHKYLLPYGKNFSYISLKVSSLTNPLGHSWRHLNFILPIICWLILRIIIKLCWLKADQKVLPTCLNPLYMHLISVLVNSVLLISSCRSMQLLFWFSSILAATAARILAPNSELAISLINCSASNLSYL